MAGASLLNRLYGPNAGDVFQAAVEEVGATSVEAFDCENTNVRVNTYWPSGPNGEPRQMKIECSPLNVHFGTLNVVSEQGIYTGLCDRLPHLMKTRGVLTFTCTPRNAESAAILFTRGEWVDQGPGKPWVWVL